MAFFNSWAIGTFVCCIFTLLLAGYLLTLRNKARHTWMLLLVYTGAFVLDLGFLISALFPFPGGAYHRFLTVPGVFLPLTAMIQFAYYYPRNYLRKESIVALIVNVVVCSALTAEFVWRCLHAEPSFTFRGEVFNFPQEFGRRVALWILVQNLWFAVVMIRKALRVEGEERRSVWQMLFAMLLPTLGPGIANMLFQSGVISHGLFQQFFVTLTLLGYFGITIVFINNAVERTSFMTKIVGISLVTFLLVVQALASLVTLRNDEHYDNYRVLEARSLRADDAPRSDSSSIAYVASYPLTAAPGAPDTEGASQPTPRLVYQRDDFAFDLETMGADIRTSIAQGRFEDRLTRAVSRQGEELFFAYHIADEAAGRVLEVGYPYLEYRAFQDESARLIVVLTLALVFLILVLYPIFFSRNLVRPLNALLDGVGEVNEGNLTVRIPVLVQDEIGYLSSSFNKMVKSILDGKQKLEEYANTLEEKVKERTSELKNTLDQVQSLKTQQDGDYFLTSLLTKPLMQDWNKSRRVSTQFFIEQKKQFQFRSRKSELGGDICVSGNLRFGDPERPERYLMFCNGDAMGKSMQGAGGALVMGTAMNYIMSRSAGNDRVLSISPEQWLHQTYHELNQIFQTFDGSMTISCVIGLINERTGRMVYFNAEHPWTVLYRRGTAQFLEEELTLRKLGSPSEFAFRVLEYQLEAGDVLFAGSDGRDDLELAEEPAGASEFAPPASASDRVINEDHDQFRRFVEECGGDLEQIVARIHAAGRATDDLSLLRIGYLETEPDLAGDERESRVRELISEARGFVRDGAPDEAIRSLEAAAAVPGAGATPLRLLGQLRYEQKQYAAAISAFEESLELDARNPDVWFQISICYKRERELEKARAAAERVRESQPGRVANLVNLGDCYRLLGNPGRARELLEEALRLEPDHRGARRAMELLKKEPA